MTTKGMDIIVETIDQQEWLDQAARPIQKAVNNLRRGRLSTAIMDFLHGVWLKHPLHPVMTDIPIGAWTAGLAMDTAEAVTGSKSFGAGADLATAIGVGGAAGAAITGITDWQYASGRTRRVGLAHAILNTLSLGLYIGSLIARKNKNRSLGFGMALAGYSTMIASAYLGGDMVYRQKMGVNHASADRMPSKFTSVMAEADLEPDTPTRVLVNETPILLVKQDDRIFALVETCAHLGAPLSEGTLTSDGTIICPWHQSQFQLDDGSIINGPSTYPQPCLDVRIYGGQIQVAFRGQ